MAMCSCRTPGDVFGRPVQPFLTPPAGLQIAKGAEKNEFEIMFAELEAWKATFYTTVIPRMVFFQPHTSTSVGHVLRTLVLAKRVRHSGIDAAAG